MSFYKTVSKDLFACTKRQGLKAVLSALIFEPGFSFIFNHRLIQILYKRGFQRTAKILWRINSMLYGCYFHITAEIEDGLYLPHPTAIVIGEGVRIGKNVTLYQSVTIGKAKGNNTYPCIKDGVVVYPNSVVFGDIIIGESAVIGAGSVVGRSIPDQMVFKDGHIR